MWLNCQRSCIEDNTLAIVVAALFMPFLSQALAVSFGAAVAGIAGGPIRFAGFKSPLASFAISTVIGITAGLSMSDDTGRRDLIGVAAAVQLAIFPVWLGAALVLGMPPREILSPRLCSFVINLIAISASAVAAYAALQRGGGAGWAAPRSHRPSNR